ncbi:UvrD-helicase domain-containing protein [Ilumatobacter nonamiensis]|uniref:UvrD-helicase domain-containing protein n=1 Tax=Ilumatobacter nonamiensis TaxID=467093 RepID=UPI00130DF183|nr:UvrD-helicase domain-containing protein [Ilumatobacter nonamiensis]
MTDQMTPPPDESDRIRIRSDLDSTLFVEAGAGAGKTSSLVQRVVNLVESGVPIVGIAAITFTEKAAAELRTRVRRELTQRDSAESSRALMDLDHAPIGTLHAFARRILNDFPIEASLPPGFGVLDELESNLRFDDEWTELLDTLLNEPNPASPLDGGRVLVELCDFENFGVDKDLKRVAIDFRYNWDLVESFVDRSDPGPFVLPLAPVIDEARDLGRTETPPGDKQAALVATIAAAAEELASAGQLSVQLELLTALAKTIGKPDRKGSKANWKALGEAALHELRDREADLVERIETTLDQVRRYRKRLAGAICGRFVLDAAASRVDAGVLDFHDLLVRARRLLATDATVRAALHDRYPRVLLDEFQDTDPIQLEIAVRLTADPSDAGQDGDWRSLTPIPGRLFIVGDPKQSIYRFRRADIKQYLQAADQVGADTARLTANFRSTSSVISFTNDVFGRMITEQTDTQPGFQTLDACRDDRLLHHGSVSVLGAEHHEDLADKTWVGETGAADELRRREAVDVVGAVTTALDEGWQVVDEDTKQLRPCRPGDICILLPTRLSLPALEAALRSIEVPYRAENASVVYASAEVRDLLIALRAADDPTDELALVAALRSPLYACSDVELWEWKQAGGTWGMFRSPPEGLDEHPVAESIRHIRSLNARVPVLGAADLLSALAEERRVFDVALASTDARDVWRRLRFVIDQARAWADAGGRGIRRYLAWARLQASDAQVSETILPERDHDAVRIMTIHASKGLEFPITVVSGMTTQPNRRRGVQVVWHDDEWHLTGRGDDGSFADVKPIDELMSDAERRRLLYVACTRAVDHLVVSLHRKSADDHVPNQGAEGYTSAELLFHCDAAGDASGSIARTFTAVEVARSGTHDAPDPVDDIEAWRAELSAVTAHARRRSAVAATRLADEVRLLRDREREDDPGLDKQPVNIDLPPWQRGRYGTSIGRAVHGTLQFCDLASGDDIDDLALSQCAAESILGLDRTVAALARSAIEAPIVREVVNGAEHWRELFIAAPVGSRVLEGYIDLLVRTDRGLVIVDYKTDKWSGPVQTAERIGRYRTQLAAYGAALEATLDEAVVGGVLVRCRAGEPPEQIEIPDWSAALDEVRSIVTSDQLV